MLIADDQRDVLTALRLLLKGEGYEVVTATSPAGVLAAARDGEHEAALIDLNYSRDTTSGDEGLDLLTQLRSLDATLPVMVMTAWSSVAGAVEAMRRGARDYIAKPWDNERLLAQLQTQVELCQALRRSRRLEQHNRLLRRRRAPTMIASARAMQPVLELIARVGPSTASVLITGEHGTGKEVVAHHLHAASERAAQPLVTVNAGGLPDGVFESELFGHVKGAFTDARSVRVGCFELADGGTLFLDEIANMPPGQQAKLLRVLQTGEFRPVGSSRVRRADVRVIAATNADLQAAVARGEFREDLLYRLNTVELHLPPLRERVVDIAPLSVHFLARLLRRYGKAQTIRGLTPEARAALERHPWPGNVRELEHVLERAVLMCQGAMIEPGALGLRPARAGAGAGAPRHPSHDLENMTLEEVERHLIQRALDQVTLEEVERHLIQRALRRCEGNVSQAAERLGLSRSALYRRLQRHGLSGAQ